MAYQVGTEIDTPALPLGEYAPWEFGICFALHTAAASVFRATDSDSAWQDGVADALFLSIFLK